MCVCVCVCVRARARALGVCVFVGCASSAIPAGAHGSTGSGTTLLRHGSARTRAHTHSLSLQLPSAKGIESWRASAYLEELLGAP